MKKVIPNMENPATWFQQGMAHQHAGRVADAIGCYQRTLTLAPRHVEAYYNMGLALQGIGSANDAITAYERALELNPNLAEAYNNLGSIFQSSRQFEKAKINYETALTLKPDFPEAHFNMGLVLKELRQITRACEHFRRAWVLSPGHIEAWDNLRTSLLGLRRIEEAVQVFVEFEKTAPPSMLLALAGLANCRPLGSFSREEHYLGLALRLYPQETNPVWLSELIGIIQYFDVDQAEIYNLYRSYNRLIAQTSNLSMVSLPPRRTRGAKLRIGYISADFRTHVMGHLMYEILSRHSREEFELFIYSLAGREHEDVLTQKFRAAVDKFVNVSGLSEQESARIIAQDDLDILVDLGGHTAYAKPGILAYKPARIQITHLGYHGAIGLESVDYKITDSYADLPENQSFLIEKLLPMDGCLLPFRRVLPAPSANYSRSALGIAEDAVVFGAFVNIQKLSPRCLATWHRILQKVGHGLLAFSPLNMDEKPSYLRLLVAAGITADRVIFIPSDKSEAINRSRYRLVDIVLDTFPYSGGDTTLAALDSGVPVVTLCGKRHSERVSYSILQNLGVLSTIAFDEAEFIDMAVRLATDEDFRAQVADDIEKGLRTSVLVDINGYVRNLEQAYLTAIEEKGVLRLDSGELSAAEMQELFVRAVRHHQAGELAEAETLYQSLLQDQPDYAPVCYLYGMLMKSRENNEGALFYLQKAINSSPHYAEAHNAMGNIYSDQREYGKAIAALEQAIVLKPSFVAALNALGLAFIRGGRAADAVAPLQAALQGAAADPEIHFNLGVAYQKQGRFDEALISYQHALAIQPQYLEAYFNSGVIFQERGLWDSAANCSREVLRLKPDYAPAYHHLGTALFSAGKISAWLDNFLQFQANCPPSFRLALYGAEACHYSGDTKKSRAYIDGLLNADFAIGEGENEVDSLEELLSLVLYFDVPEQHLLTLYQHYNTACKKAYGVAVSLPERAAGDKLRIGYLSADFRDHVMGKMMYEVISRHDKALFDIYCYSLSHQKDGWTEKFRAAADHFVMLAGLSEKQAAERIAQDSLEILIDLSTHTKGALPGVLALKPARIQITHIASCGAVGSDRIDFKLTDHQADLPENQQYLLETLLPMEGCVFPYRDIPIPKHRPYQRQKLGIPPTATVFGAFVNIMKLSPRCLEVWSRVLRETPDSLLAFSPMDDEAQAYYVRRVGVAGIDPARLVFIPFSSDESQNQARYTLVDMVLDTFPYGGVNGTLEALAAGVPVVTLCGKRHGERTSYTILINLGVTATIAYSEREFVDIVRRLASDREFYSGVVRDIQRGLKNSPLVDRVKHTRALEATYREALAKKGLGYGANSASMV